MTCKIVFKSPRYVIQLCCISAQSWWVVYYNTVKSLSIKNHLWQHIILLYS